MTGVAEAGAHGAATQLDALDLVVQQGDVVAIVEVRYRGAGAWQGALQSITRKKRDRLRQAAHWLRETDGNVSEIAYACGFKTVPHFTRKFKEHFGTPPAAYRGA